MIRFASKTDALFAASQPAEAWAIERAERFVDGLEASGGTEMQRAMELALVDDGLPVDVRQVVFATDGSIANEVQLFATVEAKLGRSRLFPIGIGSAPNGYFMKRAASFGRGTPTLIGGLGEVEVRMAELFGKLERPVLTGIELHWNDPVEMWPAKLPDLYDGEPLVVTARVPRFVGDVVVTGRRGGEPFQVRLPLRPGEPERGLAKLWARRKIAGLMDAAAVRARGRGKPDRLREQVVEIALAHHLVSKFTSLVAVDVTPSRPASAGLAGRAVPGALPAGLSPQFLPGVLPSGATPAPLWLGLGTFCLSLALCISLRGRLLGVRS